MKIFIPNEIVTGTSGCSFFCQRLVNALRRVNIDVTTNPDDVADNAVHFIKMYKTKAKRHILRLDGVYYDTSINYKSRNSPISDSRLGADYIIYQSNFSKQLCDKYLEKCQKPSSIIFNGADCVDGVNFERPNFLSSGRWRPIKRLNETIESFLLASIDDSILYIAGDISKSGVSDKKLRHYKKLKNICFLGILDQRALNKYVRQCTALLHLCYADSCPNSVVEAIAAKKPVICNNFGGTQELVSKSNGIICGIDKQYDLSPIDFRCLPKIDINIVADAMRKTTLHKFNIVNDHININNIAAEYVRVFNCGK